MPLSVTVKTSRTLPRAARSQPASRCTLPRSVNFTALSMRFSSAARRRKASPITASGSAGEISAPYSSPFASARAASEAASASARRRGRISSRRSTRPLASERTASTMSDVTKARCSAVLLIAIAQSRSRAPSSDVASSSPSARIPVSGVLISWAISASVASTARACAVRERATRLARSLPADLLRLAIIPPRAHCHADTSPATASRQANHAADIGRARAILAQRP